MPNRVEVKPYVELLTIRSLRKAGRGHTMGAVSLKNVTVTANSLQGDLIDEFTEVRELDESMLKHFTRIFPSETGGWFYYSKDSKGKLTKRVPVTGEQFRAAYAYGEEFYVSLKAAQ
jgi:hypothetical protein